MTEQQPQHCVHEKVCGLVAADFKLGDDGGIHCFAITCEYRSRPAPARTQHMENKCLVCPCRTPICENTCQWFKDIQAAKAQAREDVLKELEYYLKQPCFTQGQSESKLRWIDEKIQSLRHDAHQRGEQR
jgi:hypothetical protein